MYEIFVYTDARGAPQQTPEQLDRERAVLVSREAVYKKEVRNGTFVLAEGAGNVGQNRMHCRNDNLFCNGLYSDGQCEHVFQSLQ